MLRGGLIVGIRSTTECCIAYPNNFEPGRSFGCDGKKASVVRVINGGTNCSCSSDVLGLDPSQLQFLFFFLSSMNDE